MVQVDLTWLKVDDCDFSLYFFARHAWLLSSGCGVYSHAGSSRLMRIPLGKRPTGLRNHSPPTSQVALSPSSNLCSNLTADSKTKRKLKEKVKNRADVATAATAAAAAVICRDPDAVSKGAKNRMSPLRRPLTRSVLRASLSPITSGSTSNMNVVGLAKKTVRKFGADVVESRACRPPAAPQFKQSTVLN